MAKTKASEALAQGCSPAMVRAMVELGRYEADCDLGEPSKPVETTPAKADNVIRLPIWPEESRGVPNVALRSALFGAIRRGPRRYLKRERMASVDGMEILYTGEQLDQGDLDVWESVLHLIRKQELGKECRFTAYAILKMLGKTDTGDNRKTLYSRLMRLKVNGVEAKIGRFTYVGSLIDEIYRDENADHEYVVVANPKLRVLFERDQFTLIDWAVRLELAGQPLAQWLHGFYASHAKPYAYSVAKLHELCGSENPDMAGYKRDLRKALDSVSNACEKHGQAFSGEIRDDLVHVDRQPSKSQRKHLVGKAKKPKAADSRKNAMSPIGSILKPKQK